MSSEWSRGDLGGCQTEGAGSLVSSPLARILPQSSTRKRVEERGRPGLCVFEIICGLRLECMEQVRDLLILLAFALGDLLERAGAHGVVQSNHSSALHSVTE